MKNNRSNNKIVSFILLSSAAVVSLGVLIGIGNSLNTNKNELMLENKEVNSPVVPLSINSPSAPEKAETRKKRIRKLTLNGSRTLIVSGEIGRHTEALARQINKLSKESKEPIVLLIDSPGGSVFSGERVISAMEASKAEIYTVCDGMCASMAAIIHQYGTKRLATDRSILMFHDAAGMLGGRISEMLSLLNLIKRKLDKTNHYIANRSKISYQELVTLGANNFWIDSEDAMEKGLVDDLVSLEE